MPDPDLEIRGVGGGGGIRGVGGGEGSLPTKLFWSFWPQFGPKIRGGGWPPLDPPLQPSSKLDQTSQVTDHNYDMFSPL